MVANRAGLVVHDSAGEVDLAEFTPGGGRAGSDWSGTKCMRSDFMMFFDATARYEKRWSGNELESAASYLLFRARYKMEIEAHRPRVRNALPTHTIFVERRDRIMNRSSSSLVYLVITVVYSRACALSRA